MCDWARASRNGLHGSCEVELLFSKPLCVKKVAPFLPPSAEPLAPSAAPACSDRIVRPNEPRGLAGPLDLVGGCMFEHPVARTTLVLVSSLGRSRDGQLTAYLDS